MSSRALWSVDGCVAPCRHSGAACASVGTGCPSSSNGVPVWRTSVTHVPHPPALATEAAYRLLKGVLELPCSPLQRCAPGGSLRGDGRDDLEDLLWAICKVAASLTRWLTCSLGKVSTTRCAELTNPSSIAVAAWMASSSSISGPLKRLQKWASTSGSTKCSWEPSAWTSLIPQAYITGWSVRNRLQICSSEQANSYFNNSSANNTRVETDGRPRMVNLGKRWANEWSTAATRAAHGNVSAHWRRRCVCRTKSATCRLVHVPSAKAGDLVRAASLPLLIDGGRGPQHTTI